MINFFQIIIFLKVPHQVGGSRRTSQTVISTRYISLVVKLMSGVLSPDYTSLLHNDSSTTSLSLLNGAGVFCLLSEGNYWQRAKGSTGVPGLQVRGCLT